MYTIIISPCSLHNIAIKLITQHNIVVIILIILDICLAFATL